MNYQHTVWSNLFNLLPLVVRKGELAPEFDPSFYRLLHEDMRSVSDEELALHYSSHGRREGRMATPAAHRQGFLSSVPRDGEILEIGPFTKPAFAGDNVRFF